MVNARWVHEGHKAREGAERGIGRTSAGRKGLWHVLCRDFYDWWAAVSGARRNRSGLYDYVLHPPGGRRRLHLRVHPDGSSVLLVDVTDAIHLNPTATALLQDALDGRSPDQAVTRLRRRFGGLKANGLHEHAASIFRLCKHLRTSPDSCPTCGLRECARMPLFSTPVSAPYKVDLALTYGCNNACRHCYNGLRTGANLQKHIETPRDGGRGGAPFKPLTPTTAVVGRFSEKDSRKRSGSLLSIAQWRRVLEKLVRIGVPHVIFTGGEPTLFDGLADLIRVADRLGLVTGLNTNGRRLAERSFTERLARAGLHHVQITLESHRAEVHNAMTGADSFAETVAGIRRALAAGIYTLTNTTLTRHNAADAGSLVDFLADLGLKTIAVNGVIRAGGGADYDEALLPEELAVVVPSLREVARRRAVRFLWYTPTPYCRFSPLEFDLGPRRCNAGEYSMCIEPDGKVLPCQSYPVSVGNFLRDPWDALWNSELFRSFRRRTHNPRAAGLPESCWTCPDLSVCGGGCRLEWENTTSDQRPATAVAGV